MWRVGRAALVVLAVGFFAACQRTEQAEAGRPPVILISIDTLRADHLPLYGDRAVQTPAIDALARDGVVFDKAYAHCPMTLPSHVSMLTGLLPTEHGVRNNLGYTYDAAKFPPVSRKLRERGYVTGAAVSSYVLRGDTGLRGAFDWYEDSIDPRGGAAFGDYQRSGAVTVPLAEKWIDENAAHPLFFFLHLYEPHVPYEPPEPFRSRYRSAYDGEIATADALVGRFLDHLRSRGLYDKALIILTSDHGEGLGDHGEAQHSILLYTEAIHVPLVVKLPGNASHGERVQTLASVADIAPTIAALTGVSMTTPHATSLFALPAARRVYSETVYPYVQLGWSDLRSLIDGGVHYIDSSKPELYRLASDPHERTNAIDGERRLAASFRAEIDTYPRVTAASPVSPEDAARLASLGYLGGVRARPDPRTLPNPRDVIGLLAGIQQAFELANQQRPDEAVTKLRAILQTNPRLVEVWIKLAETYDGMGRTNDAIDAYRQAIAVSGVVPSDVVVALGGEYLAAGRTAEARRAAMAGMGGAPDRASALLVRVALAEKNLDEAERMARSLTVKGSAPEPFMLLAEVLKARGDLAGAMNALAAAETRGRNAGMSAVFDLEASRGDILARSERPAEAIAAYEREIASFPLNRLAYPRLAVLYFVTGNRPAVERTLDRMVKADRSPAARRLAQTTRVALQ